jgi:hypothetical protein
MLRLMQRLANWISLTLSFLASSNIRINAPIFKFIHTNIYSHVPVHIQIIHSQVPVHIQVFA